VKESILKIYLKIFNFVAQERIKKKDLPVKYIHAHLVSMLSTGVLMWSYTILAFITIESPIPGIIGLICSSIHLLSPLLYLRNNRYFLNCFIFISTGIIHQMSFSYFTGGFDSNILIWLGILPMLAGVIAGRKGALTWALITTSCIFLFLVFKLSGYPFPVAISKKGLMWSQGLILFGWVFISTSVIWVHVLLVEIHSKHLENSRQRVQNLMNILTHDISTPLVVISLKLKHLIKTDMNDEQLSDTLKALKAAERVIEMMSSLKELRLNEMGKAQIVLKDVEVRAMMIDLKEIFLEKLDHKNLTLNWSVASDVYTFYTSRSLLLNQILGNLLSNAIKFSAKNSEIRLRVSRAKEGVLFILEDSGVGIPRDLRENLFEASLSKSLIGTDGEVGTGFGLPIVKSCVDRLGGSITFETRTLGEGVAGTRFKLLFPV